MLGVTPLGWERDDGGVRLEVEIPVGVEVEVGNVALGPGRHHAIT